MPQVDAILEAASSATAASSTIVPVTPTPDPVSMIGTPTLTTWISATDLGKCSMKYGYLVYQTYSAANGVTGLAQATGTSDWVTISCVCDHFPNIDVSGLSATSALAGGVVTFTISGDVSYTQTTPGIYSVTTV